MFAEASVWNSLIYLELQSCIQVLLIYNLSRAIILLNLCVVLAHFITSEAGVGLGVGGGGGGRWSPPSGSRPLQTLCTILRHPYLDMRLTNISGCKIK